MLAMSWIIANPTMYVATQNIEERRGQVCWETENFSQIHIDLSFLCENHCC